MNKKELKKISAFVIFSLFLTSFAFAAITWSNSEGTNFNVGDRPVCYNDGAFPYWLENGVQNDSSLDCRRLDGISNLGLDTTFCCPLGYLCDIDDSNKWACFESSDNDEINPNTMDIISCSNFTTPLACMMWGSNTNLPEKIKRFIEEKNKASVRDYITEVMGITNYDKSLEFCDNSKGPFEVKGNGKCYKITNCQCEWNDVKKTCDDVFIVNKECAGANIEYEQNDLSCEQTESQIKNYCDEAIEDNRKIVRSWTAKLVNKSGYVFPETPDCKSGTIESPCPPATISGNTGSRVPFIGFFGIISAIAIIIAVYIFRKNRKS